MKKFLSIFTAVLFCMITISSCSSKGSEFTYYSFNNGMKISSFNHNSDVSQIDKAFSKRMNIRYDSETQARNEWKAFLSEIDDSSVKINEGDYYKVTLAKMGIVGDYFEPIEILESVEWDNQGRHEPANH